MDEHDGKGAGTPEPMRPEKAEAAEAASQPRLAAEAARPAVTAPRLAAGIELIGEYKESGYKEPPYIARRADGQVIQLTYLLHLVASAVDGRRGYR